MEDSMTNEQRVKEALRAMDPRDFSRLKESFVENARSVGEAEQFPHSEFVQARYSIQRTATPRMAKVESTTASPRISVRR